MLNMICGNQGAAINLQETSTRGEISVLSDFFNLFDIFLKMCLLCEVFGLVGFFPRKTTPEFPNGWARGDLFSGCMVPSLSLTGWLYG